MASPRAAASTNFGAIVSDVFLSTTASLDQGLGPGYGPDDAKVRLCDAPRLFHTNGRGSPEALRGLGGGGWY